MQAAETPPPRPGDLICGNCGIGNDPARKFCRRCGTSLAEAVVHVQKVPWWRRILPRREKKPLAAGERPKSMTPGGAVGGARRSYRRAMGIVFQVLLLAAVVGMVVGYAVVPPWQGAVNDVIGSLRRMVAPELVAVNTAGKAVGGDVPGHPAQMAVDGFNTTYWAEDLVEGKKPSFRASFSPPTPIDKVLVTSGASDDFQAYARPRVLRVELLDPDDKVVASVTLELKDVKEFQVFDVKAQDVATVRFTVLDVYKSIKRSQVAITEIEFRAAK